MPSKYGVSSSASTRIKWRREYRNYKAGRLRLHMYMISLMLFVSVSVVCTVFLFKNSFSFYPSKYALNKGDMRAVQVSTLFCEGIVVKKANFNRRITVVSPAKRLQATRRSALSTRVVLLRRDRHWYRSFYLLKDSVVNMRLTSHHSVSVYWLKGRGNLDEWTKEMNKVLKQSFRTPTERYTKTIMDETFIVNDDNNYYLGITIVAGDTNYSQIDINFTIARVVYNTRFYTSACNASAEDSCQVRLRFNSLDTAVIEVEDDRTDAFLFDVWTVWYCQPRLWIYFSIFGGVFILGIFILFLIYVCVMSKVNKKVPKRKPSQIPSRTESFNTYAVILQSINTTDGPSNHIDANSIELSTLSLTPRPKNHQSDLDLDKIVDEIAVNDSTAGLTTSMNETDQNVDSQLWQTTPSPRWSTFLQNADLDYEECVTNFKESPTNTPVVENTFDVYDRSEGDRLGKELEERLQRLKAENVVYEGPKETDIDDSDDDIQDDSELEPFTYMDSKDTTTTFGPSGVEQDVTKRRRENRREQRWEPRLSMVTEV